MGAAYSQGAFTGCVSHYVGQGLEKVYMRRLAFQRVCKEDAEEDCFFMSRPQFARTFGLSVEAAAQQFRIFDPVGRGVIPSTDVLGALAILADAKVSSHVEPSC
jgi:hypothetical protein